MATLRNKRELAALNKESCEEHPKSNLAQNLNAPRSQILEKIEVRVTKKLSQEFSRTESRILGAFPSRRLSSEPANSGSFRNRSGDVPKRILH